MKNEMSNIHSKLFNTQRRKCNRKLHLGSVSNMMQSHRFLLVLRVHHLASIKTLSLTSRSFDR
jgi:hypothetical protein